MRKGFQVFAMAGLILSTAASASTMREYTFADLGKLQPHEADAFSSDLAVSLGYIHSCPEAQRSALSFGDSLISLRFWSNGRAGTEGMELRTRTKVVGSRATVDHVISAERPIASGPAVCKIEKK